jgi:hypothetical protein
MIRWLVLLTLCAFTPSGLAFAQPTKTYHYPDFSIGFPGNYSGSIIRKMALTVTQDPNDRNNTKWSLAFYTYNANWDTDRGMWQGRLIIYLKTPDDSPVPWPDAAYGPDSLQNIYSWRDACYYNRYRQYQGGWLTPYSEFIRIVDHILPNAIWLRSAIDKC